MESTNPFEAEWRACLEAHYRHVLTVNDTLNERSLVTVLHSAGFSAADVAQIRADFGLVDADVVAASQPATTVAWTTDATMNANPADAIGEDVEDVAQVAEGATPIAPESAPAGVAELELSQAGAAASDTLPTLPTPAELPEVPQIPLPTPPRPLKRMAEPPTQLSLF